VQIINWNEERMGRLERLYREGLSFSLIADDIGVTRSAAIGKARRMKLPKRVEIAVCKMRPVAARPPPRERRRHRVTRLDAPELPAAEYVPDQKYYCSIYDLKDRSCRYPLWQSDTLHPERRYCGFPTASVSAGLPYCRHHTRLCGPTHGNE
jgi:hypothetical protein